MLINATESARDYFLLRFAYESGMRIGEINRCKIEDLDFSDDNIKVHILPFKCSPERTIELRKQFSKELVEWLYGSKKGFLFLSNRNEKMSIRQMQYVMEKYSKKINIEQRNFHTLRHTHIRHRIEMGEPYWEVKKDVGHKHLNGLDWYAQSETIPYDSYVTFAR